VLDTIYQQICLRNLQGIILLDLLKNMTTTEQEQVIEYLKKLFKHDITNTKVLGFSHSGLCELIRQKF
jgi:Ribonuclease G/E